MRHSNCGIYPGHKFYCYEYYATAQNLERDPPSTVAGFRAHRLRIVPICKGDNIHA